MTVGELQEYLDEFDADMEVCIGMVQQSYGSNFAMDISCQPELLTVDVWHEGEQEKVVITQGGQIGTVRYEEW